MRETPKQALHSQCGEGLGAQAHEVQDHNLSGNQEPDAQITEPPRHPNSILILE